MPIRRTSLIALSAIAATLLSLSACTSPAPRPNAPPPPTLGESNGMVPTLVAHQWKLVSATNAQNQRINALFPSASKPITLGFSDTRLSIQGGCNLRGGSFQINAAQQLVVGPMPATMMACEPALMQADQALAAALAQPAQIQADKGPPAKLTLVTAAKDTLVFAGNLTPEAMYGPGTLMFLEVAPQKVACNHPLIRDAQCMQVRERKFDAQGLPVNPPGAWQAFYSNIDGFTHTAGQRNVLRVKRFTRANTPADASSFVWVLDMVVESEQVK